MIDAIVGSAYFGVIISVAGYALGVFLKKKFKRSFLNPLFDLHTLRDSGAAWLSTSIMKATTGAENTSLIC